MNGITRQDAGRRVSSSKEISAMDYLIFVIATSQFVVVRAASYAAAKRLAQAKVMA